MIVVTGGAGFIGSNIVKGLNAMGRKDILVVDDLSDARKFKNIVDCDIADYLDKNDFIERLSGDSFDGIIDVMFHLGANSDTTATDGRAIMDNNYEYSKTLFHYCAEDNISFLYASSAATYGDGQVFKEGREYEAPLNVYGYSKFLFDQYVRRHLDQVSNQVVGLRYFNVYGPREQHKDKMASVAYHFNNQIKKEGVLNLFEGSDGYSDGEQRRDFIYVGDVVDANLWFFKNAQFSGIFNIGTGRSQSFNDVAKAVIDFHKKGKIQYIAFPEQLKGKYQSFTQADISALRALGYHKSFKTVEEGVKEYLMWLTK